MLSHLGYFQHMNSNLEKLVRAEVTGLVKNDNSGFKVWLHIQEDH